MLEIRGIWLCHMSRWDRYVLRPQIWMEASRSGTVPHIGTYSLLVISLGSILLILKLLFILTMLPLSIFCRKRTPNQDSLDGYSFFKNLICRLSIEKEKTIRWRIIFQGWKISHMILFQSTTVSQMNSLLL